MVSDIRVSRLLEQRLGGVYRDPARIIRDVSLLLKSSSSSSSGGSSSSSSTNNHSNNNNNSTYNLQPIVTVYANERTGDTSEVLTLQGTIAIHYKGQTYQLLMDIYIIPEYPIQPPICYVRLVPNMYIKSNHSNVNQEDGRVMNIEYIQEWNQHTHTLIELMIHLSSIFSNDPPVFSRPPPPIQQPAPPVVVVPTVHSSSSSSSYYQPQHHQYHLSGSSSAATTPPRPATTVGNTTIQSAPSSTGSNWRIQQEQLELALAQEASMAAAAAAAVEDVNRNTQQQQDQEMNIMKIYEQEQLQQMKYTLNAKIQTYLREQKSKIQQYIVEDINDYYHLTNNTSTKTTTTTNMKSIQIQDQIQYYQTMQNQLQHQIQIVDDKTIDIQQWLALQKEYMITSQQQNGMNNKDEKEESKKSKKSIDELVIPTSSIQNQIVLYDVEYNTIQDTLYYLDKALYESYNNNSNNNNTSTTTSITLEQHMKHVRSLAKQQFYIKAHLYKLIHLLQQRKEQIQI